MFRMPIRFSLALCLAAFLAAGPGAAQIPIDQDDLLEDVGQYSPPWFAELQDVEIDGDLAYVFGVGGLAIMDIDDPATPILLGRYEPPGHPFNRFYRGAVGATHAYGGAREDLLGVISIANEAAPTLATVHGDTGTSYEGMAIRANRLYAARHADGLEILDLILRVASECFVEIEPCPGGHTDDRQHDDRA